METLSGMDGRNIDSIKKQFALKYSGGMSLEETFSKRSRLAFCNLGMGLTSIARKWEANIVQVINNARGD